MAGFFMLGKENVILRECGAAVRIFKLEPLPRDLEDKLYFRYPKPALNLGEVA